MRAGRALLVVCILMTLGGGAWAGAAAVDSTSVGRSKGFNRPFWVMMRSAAIPGWGQVKNGKWLKAIVLGGTETGLFASAVRQDRLASDARHNEHARPADEAAFWAAEADAHVASKKDYVWWGAFTVLLSLGDAYVDAHLKGFDAEFKMEDSAVMLSVGVRW